MDHQKLAQCLEILCQSGCETVNATIKAMENNQAINLSQELSDEEYQIVLHELKTIMAVYTH